MESRSYVNKRADVFSLENAHPKELHFDSGEPVFLGNSKHVTKRVDLVTLYCPDCSNESEDDYVALYNDKDGDKSCRNECGYLSGSGPRLEISEAAAGRVSGNNSEY